MPRSADRIAGKFFNLESHPSMRRNAPSPNQKFVFRRRVNSQGQSPKRTSTGVSPVALNRKSISLLEAIKMTDSVHSSEASPRKSTPVMRAGSTPRASIIDTGDGDVELIVEKDDGGVDVFEIVGQANVDGVRHLQEGSCFSRGVWAVLISVFVVLAAIQIIKQIVMYYETPVATNILADYPSKIIFPTVAICNNNQYRLTYITGSRLQNRQPKPNDPGRQNVTNITNVYDKALVNAWDMDAVKFLRNAAHWKSRMILKCNYPNGKKCRLSDFKAIWTLTGLCWAINTDPMDPIYATRGGSSHSLSLLLNIEKYERIESCTNKFRSTKLPGLKILIYNQTDIPVSSQDGVNIPPGFTMDIPFKIQHRKKFPGEGCLSEDERANADSTNSVHSCELRKYLTEIEYRCGCSMRRAYNPNPDDKFPFCNVRQYFDCVDVVLKSSNQSTFTCKPSCNEVDFTAWQDLTLLPDNILPRTVESDDVEDEHEIIDEIDDDLSDDDNDIAVDGREGIQDKLCNDHLLADDTAIKVKRYAEKAFEKRARYQDDHSAKTDKLIKRLRDASAKLVSLKYGWTNENYMSTYERLSTSVQCFKSLRENNTEFVALLDSPTVPQEEKLAKEFYKMLDKPGALKEPEKYRDLKSLDNDFGDRFDSLFELTKDMTASIIQVWKLYKADTYAPQLGKNLDRFDRILELIDQYEGSRLKRRAWADKMNSRNMRNFYDQEFYEVWYNPTLKDLDHTLVRKISDLELNELPELKNASSNITMLEAGAINFLSDMSDEHVQEFGSFIRQLHDCTENELKNKSEELLKEFKKAIGEFQSAYTDLFRKELSEYLEQFRFGERFIKENFAMVNVYFHKLGQEHWVQDSTYSVWSLACDVGGALGLFLGASLLTLIELLYLCCQYGVINRCCWDNYKKNRKMASPEPSPV